MEDNATESMNDMIKNQNEPFNLESNQDEFNDEQQDDSEQTPDNDEEQQQNDENRSTTNEDEENSENDEEEDESDDDITITINDINNVAAAASTAANSSFTYQPVNLNLNKRGPGQIVQNLVSTAKSKPTGLDIEQAGQFNGQSIFDLNLDSLEDKPWRKPGADITDYFNYGFTEDSWKIYCDRQKRLRNEMNPNDTSTLINNDRLMSNSNASNQNGNNIVLRTFTNHNSMNNNSSGLSQSNANSNLQQIKSEPMNPLSSINENSKYLGNLQLKKAGPPPGRKQFGQIEVINSGSQTAPPQQANQQPIMQPSLNMNNLNNMNNMNNLNPNMMMNNMNNMSANLQQQQQQRRPDIKENFHNIQVIGQRPGGPLPPQQMPPNMPPFGLPPFGIPPPNQGPPPMEFSQMMQNQMNYPPPEFMGSNQGPPPQIPQMPVRFPVMNNQMEMNFEEQQQSAANRPRDLLFREQDQDDRRDDRRDYSHGNNRSTRNNYSSREYNRDSNRDEDYRRSRDKDYESSSRSRVRSPSRRSRSPRRSRHERSKSPVKSSRRRSRSRDRRRRDKSRDRDHKSSSSSSHNKRSKIKEEPAD